MKLLKSKNAENILRIIFTILTQGSLGIMSFLTTIILPNIMGPAQYGYMQKFVFYLSYLNVLSLGFNDGLTLNYAGKQNASTTKLRSALFIQIIYSGILTGLFLMIAFTIKDSANKFIVIMLGINVLPTIIICIINGIILAEGKTFLYNISTIAQRLIFCVWIIVFLVSDNNSFQYMITANTIGNILCLFWLFVIYRKYFIGKKATWKEGAIECKKLYFSGIQISLSVILLSLFPAFGRILIERFETIEIYGIYSFYISLLSIALTFTNAVGVIAFPMIKQLSQDAIPTLYIKMERIYRVIGLLIFLCYFLIYFYIKKFLNAYVEGLNYLPILLLLCYPMGKIQVLMTPIYKTYRKEKNFFILNLISIILLILIEGVIFFFSRSVFAVAWVTSIMVYFFYIILNIYAPIEIKKHLSAEMIWDYLIPFVFLLGSTCSNIWLFLILFTVFSLICIFIWKKKRMI